jgi:hypothetical protein
MYSPVSRLARPGPQGTALRVVPGEGHALGGQGRQIRGLHDRMPEHGQGVAAPLVDDDQQAVLFLGHGNTGRSSVCAAAPVARTQATDHVIVLPDHFAIACSRVDSGECCGDNESGS